MWQTIPFCFISALYSVPAFFFQSQGCMIRFHGKQYPLYEQLNVEYLICLDTDLNEANHCKLILIILQHDWTRANRLLSVLISHLYSTTSLCVSQECWCVLWGLSALHSVCMVSASQFDAGHLCHAGQGDRHHCVWSVRALRCPGALPQASNLVSKQGFCLIYVFFLSWFMWPWSAECVQFFSNVWLYIYTAKLVYTWELPTAIVDYLSWNWRVFFWNSGHT